MRQVVNIQNFLQVLQGSGIRKKEDKLTSADLLFYIVLFFAFAAATAI